MDNLTEQTNMNQRTYWGSNGIKAPVHQLKNANTFSELALNYFESGVALPYTRAEYHALPLEQQKEVKLIAYVTSCSFKEGSTRRSDANADKIQLVILDIDNSFEARDVINSKEVIRDQMGDLNFLIHTTISHTEENPRLRVVVSVAESELNTRRALSRHVANLLGITKHTHDDEGNLVDISMGFDSCSVVTSQAFFRPVVFKDDEEAVIVSRTSGIDLTVADLPADVFEEIVPEYSYLSGNTDWEDSIEDLPIPNFKLEWLEQALDKLDPDAPDKSGNSYLPWLFVICGFRHQFRTEEKAERAFEIFNDWSARGAKYGGREATHRKWRSINPQPKDRRPITIRTTLKRAIKAGWDCADMSKDVLKSTTKIQRPKQWLTFKTPKQLAEYEIPEGFMILGDCHLTRGSITVIGGYPGVGKSRAATGLAVAGATGKSWMGHEVHANFRTMILQVENGSYRLKQEMEDIMKSVPAKIDLDDFLRVTEPPTYGFDFSDENFKQELREHINEFDPSVIIIDPWNRVVEGDKVTDYRLALDAIMSCLPEEAENKPAVVVIHHLRKKSGNSERKLGRDLLHELAGSYQLGSAARCVFAIEAGSSDPDDTTIVTTCCKNNDGIEGTRSAWIRGNGLFEPYKNFDFEKFDNGEKAEPTITAEILREVFEGKSFNTKREMIATLVKEDVCKKTKGYELLKKFSNHIKKKKDDQLIWEANPELNELDTIN